MVRTLVLSGSSREAQLQEVRRVLYLKWDMNEYDGVVEGCRLTREDSDGEHARPELVCALGRLWGCWARGNGGDRSRNDAIFLCVLGF